MARCVSRHRFYALWLLSLAACATSAEPTETAQPHATDPDDDIPRLPSTDLHNNYHVWAVELHHPSTLEPITESKHARRFAEERGFHHLGPVGELAGIHLVAVPNEGSSGDVINQRMRRSNDRVRKRSVREAESDLVAADAVKWFELQVPRKRVKRTAIPDRRAATSEEMVVEEGDAAAVGFRRSGATAPATDDMPFVDPLYKFQWHLHNRLASGGLDINVLPVWKQGVNGSGIIVSIIDDGLDFRHPDLKDAYSPSTSWDFNANQPDPLPQQKEDRHGTRCAGEIAARPNHVCGVGVAYGAKISGERLISGTPTDADEAQALNFHMQQNHIYTSSWGPDDNGMIVAGPDTLAHRALIEGIKNGRGGRGSIFVFASGNGGDEEDGCNYDGYANSPYTIAIGAVDSRGGATWYSESCAALLGVTLSSGLGNFISTTDKGGGCTSEHSGTSAAAPIAAGIIALMLSVRPELSWRDVQHLIVDHGVHNDRKDLSWDINGSGRLVSHKYGFGMMDTLALVTASRNHTLVPEPVLIYATQDTTVNQEIPNAGSELMSTITIEAANVTGLTFLESVQVSVSLRHPYRGNLNIELDSPAGTRSVLASERTLDNSTEGYEGWKFNTVRNWGESPTGTWKLYVSDVGDPSDPDTGALAEKGEFQAWSLTFYGTCTGAAIERREDGRSGCVTTTTVRTSVPNAKSHAKRDAGILAVVMIVVLGTALYLRYGRRRNRAFAWQKSTKGGGGGVGGYEAVSSIGLAELGKSDVVVSAKEFRRIASAEMLNSSSKKASSLESEAFLPTSSAETQGRRAATPKDFRNEGQQPLLPPPTKTMTNNLASGRRSVENLGLVRSRSLMELSQSAEKAFEGDAAGRWHPPAASVESASYNADNRSKNSQRNANGQGSGNERQRSPANLSDDVPRYPTAFRSADIRAAASGIKRSQSGSRLSTTALLNDR